MGLMNHWKNFGPFIMMKYNNNSINIRLFNRAILNSIDARIYFQK